MKTIKRVLTYLLNKTGSFIILDLSESVKAVTESNHTHYSMNLSFWAHKKTLDEMFINGEPASIEHFAWWSRHLQAEEVKTLLK